MNLLEEFSVAVEVSDIRSPEGRQLLTFVIDKLRKVLPPGCWPKPYQILGCCYAHLTRDRCLIGDSPGVGKTHQAISRLALFPRPAVIITTASTLGEPWTSELLRWIPKLPLVILDAENTPIPRRPSVFLTTWTLLETHAARLKLLQPQLVIADEAHYAVNPETRRYKALSHLVEGCPGLLLLTGTPVNNKAEELWTLLNLLDAAAWPDPAPFEEVDAEDVDAGFQSRLHKKIRQYMIRRTKDKVLKDLPDKQEHHLLVDVDEADMVNYRRAEQQFSKWLTEQMTRRVTQELRKARKDEDPAEIEAEVQKRVERSLRTEYFTKLGHLRSLTGRMKVKPALQWLVNTVGAGEQVLVLAEHKDVIAGLAEGLQQRRIPFVQIVGATSQADRKSAMKQFQEGKAKVFLGSRAAREGITLTRAARCLRVERAFTSTGEEQGEDRLHRVGQTRKVIVTTLHARNTVDVRLAEINHTKREIVNRVVNGGVKAVKRQ